MDLLSQFIKGIDIIIIQTLVPMILAILLIGRIFKERFQIAKSLKVISWLIIGFTILNLTHYIILRFTNTSTPVDISDHQKNIYLFFRTCTLAVPLILLIKKFATKPTIILFVAFIMNLGWRMELYVIITTTYFRDYPNIPMQTHSLLLPSLYRIFQGVALGVVLLSILEILNRKERELTNIIDSDLK